MILEVQANTGKIDEGLYASFAELLWVTDTASLQDQRRAESSTRHDDLLPSPIGLGLLLTRVKRLGWYGLNTNRLTALENDLVNLGVDSQVKILVNRTSAVDISMGRVASPSSVAVDPFQPMLSTVSGD